MSEVITVEILNWEKFNPRKDIKKPWWFACSNSIFDDHEFFDFTHTELISWVYILSIASKKHSPIITIHWAHVEKVGRIKQKDFLGAISKLERNNCVKTSVQDPYAIRTGSVRDPNATLQDITEQDTTLQDTTMGVEDLVNIWNENCKSLGKVQKLTLSRKTHANRRIKENPDPAYWIEVATRIEASDFCKGNSSTAWVASFDWFITPDAHVKVMEGKYQNKTFAKGKASKHMTVAEALRLQEASGDS